MTLKINNKVVSGVSDSVIKAITQSGNPKVGLAIFAQTPTDVRPKLYVKAGKSTPNAVFITPAEATALAAVGVPRLVATAPGLRGTVQPADGHYKAMQVAITSRISEGAKPSASTPSTQPSSTQFQPSKESYIPEIKPADAKPTVTSQQMVTSTAPMVAASEDLSVISAVEEEEEPAGMSTGAKIATGVAVIAVLGGLGYLAYTKFAK